MLRMNPKVKMAQQLKWLLHRQEWLPKPPESRARQHTLAAQYWGAHTGIPGASWPASVTEMVSSRFTESLSQNTRWINVHTWVNTHMHTQIEPQRERREAVINEALCGKMERPTLQIERHAVQMSVACLLSFCSPCTGEPGPSRAEHLQASGRGKGPRWKRLRWILLSGKQVRKQPANEEKKQSCVLIPLHVTDSLQSWSKNLWKLCGESEGAWKTDMIVLFDWFLLRQGLTM